MDLMYNTITNRRFAIVVVILVISLGFSILHDTLHYWAIAVGYFSLLATLIHLSLSVNKISERL